MYNTYIISFGCDINHTSTSNFKHKTVDCKASFCFRWTTASLAASSASYQQFANQRNLHFFGDSRCGYATVKLFVAF